MRVLLLLAVACQTGDRPVAPGRSGPSRRAPEAPPTAPQSEDGPRIGEFVFKPAVPTAFDRLTVDVRVGDGRNSDPTDVDLVWVVNGQRLIDEVSSTLGEGIVKKGDEVHVEATATSASGESHGTSPTIVIANAPPQFHTDPRDLGALDGFPIDASDPDGDLLTYSIAGGPPGMRIDPESGILQYRGDLAGPGGDYQVVVTADDGDGGTARWTFAAHVAPGSGALADDDGPPPMEAPPSPPAAPAGPPVDSAATARPADEARSASPRDEVQERRGRDEVQEFAPDAASVSDERDDAHTWTPPDDGS